MVKSFSILLILCSLHGSHLLIRPGTTFTKVPVGLTSDRSMYFGLRIGLTATIDITQTVGIGFGFCYNHKRYEELWSPMDFEDIMISYHNLFRLSATDNTMFYSILGIGMKFALIDFSSRDKTTWTLSFGQGVMFKQARHFAIVPEVSGLIELTPDIDFHGVAFTLGLGYVF